MYPILWQSGDFLIPAWHVFVAFGAMSGFGMLLWLNDKLAYSFAMGDLKSLFVASYLGGLMGARLLDAVVVAKGVPGLSDVFQLGGMVFYGGLIGGLVCGGFYIWWRQLDFTRLLDLAVPALLFGQGWGRIGCFLNGDDYGKVISLEVAPAWLWLQNPVLGDGLPRYPVQLMETVGVWGFVAVMVVCSQRFCLRPGQWGYFGLGYYGVVRFFFRVLAGGSTRLGFGRRCVDFAGFESCVVSVGV